MKRYIRTMQRSLRNLTSIVGILYQQAEHIDENAELEIAAYAASSFLTSNLDQNNSDPDVLKKRIDTAARIIGFFSQHWHIIDMPAVSRATQRAVEILHDTYPEQALLAGLASVRTAGYDETVSGGKNSLGAANNFLALAGTLVKRNRVTEGNIGKILLQALPEVAISADNEGTDEAAGAMWKRCATLMLVRPEMRETVVNALVQVEEIDARDSGVRPVFVSEAAELRQELGRR